jgi:hypothetical protein
MAATPPNDPLMPDGSAKALPLKPKLATKLGEG